MPSKSYEQLKKDAEDLHARIYGLDRAHAVLEILGVFIQIIEDRNRDVLDAVENTLLHKDHH